MSVAAAHAHMVEHHPEARFVVSSTSDDSGAPLDTVITLQADLLGQEFAADMSFAHDTPIADVAPAIARFVATWAKEIAECEKRFAATIAEFNETRGPR